MICSPNLGTIVHTPVTNNYSSRHVWPFYRHQMITSSNSLVKGHLSMIRRHDTSTKGGVDPPLNVRKAQLRERLLKFKDVKAEKKEKVRKETA